MKHFPKLALLFFLSTFLFSCQDHLGVPTEGGKRVRLKRFYVSTVMVPSRAYNSYYDFFYDELGRMNSIPHFTIDKNGTPVMDEHTILYYDSKGRVERERTDGMESRSTRYGYDSLNRVENIWINIDGSTGVSGFHFLYDGQGLPWERLFYALNANGDSTTISRERYNFDVNGNLESLVQKYSSNVSPPFTRTTTYQYDDKPNPWLQIPAHIFRTSAFSYSRNNAISFATQEVYSPPTAPYSFSHQFNNKYNNGLLEETEFDQQYALKILYETY